MNRDRVPSLLGLLAGVFLILGAIVALVLGTTLALVGFGLGSFFVGLGTAVLAGIFGLLAWVMTFYARGNGEQKLVGGVALLVVGALGWTFLGMSVLAVVGATLAFFGGLIFTLETMLPSLRAAWRSVGPI